MGPARAQAWPPGHPRQHRALGIQALAPQPGHPRLDPPAHGRLECHQRARESCRWRKSPPRPTPTHCPACLFGGLVGGRRSC
eukprot:5532492-Heterocapsa_arctica.AAC.1